MHPFWFFSAKASRYASICVHSTVFRGSTRFACGTTVLFSSRPPLRTPLPWSSQKMLSFLSEDLFHCCALCSFRPSLYSRGPIAMCPSARSPCTANVAALPTRF
ncbi:hypothetical protein TRVL_03526 [Trypanosoma vivax]|nr:hypothetical protein TRVL_03526 [Trypanosoma vivax]